MSNLETTGAARTSETLLRAIGGRTVLLRVPGGAAARDEGEQLGLAEPQFQDVPLAPCVFRKTGSRQELLISAAAVAAAVGSLAFDSAAVLFSTAAGVVVDDDVLLIESMVPVEAAGVAAAYCVRLREKDSTFQERL